MKKLYSFLLLAFALAAHAQNGTDISTFDNATNNWRSYVLNLTNSIPSGWPANPWNQGAAFFLNAPNGINLFGPTTNNGPVYVPTNLAPFTVISNFTPQNAGLYTNNSRARTTWRGPYQLQCGSSTGTASNCTIISFNVNLNGTLAFSDPLYVSTLGIGTNYNGGEESFELGPGDYFQTFSSASGNGSVVSYGTWCEFTK